MNSFSIKRIALLLRSEFKILGRELLIGLVSSTIILVLVQLFIDINNSGGVRSIIITEFFPIFIFVFSFVYFVRVHNMIHEKRILPFVSIPTTALEKYIQILLTGIVFLVMTLVMIQINFWVELWLRPTIILEDLWSNKMLFERTTLINPFLGFDHGLPLLGVFMLGSLLLTATLFPKKRYAIPLFFIVPIAFFSLLSYVLLEIYDDVQAFSISPGEELGSVESMVAITMCVIGVIFMVVSYFAIRNKQVKS